MICSGNSAMSAAPATHTTVPNSVENQNACRVRGLLPAPKLYPATGWKPCPMPMIMERTSR